MIAKKTQRKPKAKSATKSNNKKARSRPTKQDKPDLTKYVKVDRLGKVSIYRRHKSYWLYFRDSGKSIRKKIDGNLNTARSTATL